MVNWKEDVEFFYCLCVLVSLIVAFFAVYPVVGVELAAVVVVILGLVRGYHRFRGVRKRASIKQMGENI